jgi:hypothetical protein
MELWIVGRLFHLSGTTSNGDFQEKSKMAGMKKTTSSTGAPTSKSKAAMGFRPESTTIWAAFNLMPEEYETAQLYHSAVAPNSKIDLFYGLILKSWMEENKEMIAETIIEAGLEGETVESAEAKLAKMERERDIMLAKIARIKKA